MNIASQKSVTIKASPAAVWNALTEPGEMKRWMSEEEIRIETNWHVGSTFTISGQLSGHSFENTGHVLAFEPHRVLGYSHRSSLSRLPDQPESYSRITFELVRQENTTRVDLYLENFPTHSIERHLSFYWSATLNVLKHFVEEKAKEAHVD